MKTLINILLKTSMLSLLFLILSCSDEYTNVEPPSVSLKMDKDSAVTMEEVTFTVVGDADYLVIWTGDRTHNYENYQEYIAKGDTTPGTIKKPSDAGAVIDKTNIYKYQYKLADTVKIVLIATNIGDFGNIKKEQKIEKEIIIKAR